MRGRRWWAPVAVAVLAGAVLAMLAAVWAAPGRYWTNEDFDIYYRYARAFRDGLSLYGPVPGTRMPFTYPPFAVLVLLPASALPPWTAAIAAAVGSLGALLLVVWRLLGSVPDRVALTAGICAVALWTEPVQADLLLGQINLLIVLLVVIDLVRPPGRRFSGLGVGLAAGIKVTPALFAVHLLLARRYRAFGTAVAAFAGTVLLGLLIAPANSARYWTGGFLGTSRIWRIASPSFVSNQSLYGLAVRTVRQDGGPQVSLLWLALAAPAAVLGLYAAQLAERQGERGLAVGCVGVATLLLSPVSWSHHWVWSVVAVVAAGSALRRAASRARMPGVAAVAGSVLLLAAWPGYKNGAPQPTGLIWRQPWSSSPAGGRPEWRWTGLEYLAGNAYIWLGLLFLAAVAITAAPRRAAVTVPPPGSTRR